MGGEGAYLFCHTCPPRYPSSRGPLGDQPQTLNLKCMWVLVGTLDPTLVGTLDPTLVGTLDPTLVGTLRIQAGGDPEPCPSGDPQDPGRA